jgi:hypothetical protein
LSGCEVVLAERTREAKVCCCCGLFKATEPNGLCKDCAKNCVAFLLKDKPCATINMHNYGFEICVVQYKSDSGEEREKAKETIREYQKW